MTRMGLTSVRVGVSPLPPSESCREWRFQLERGVFQLCVCVCVCVCVCTWYVHIIIHVQCYFTQTCHIICMYNIVHVHVTIIIHVPLLGVFREPFDTVYPLNHTGIVCGTQAWSSLYSHVHITVQFGWFMPAHHRTMPHTLTHRC